MPTIKAVSSAGSQGSFTADFIIRMRPSVRRDLAPFSSDGPSWIDLVAIRVNHNGITLRGLSQLTFATKSAISGHSGSTLDVLWTLLIDSGRTECYVRLDPSHLETWAQTEEVPVVEHQIRYDDGAGYERYMGSWSRLAGEVFLDWLAPRPGLRWIDIGCGNGAFTELLVQRCAPAEVQGIDPSEAQLAFARTRPAAHGAAFHQGDAMALPFPQDRFDAAVMALVIFFVPDPARGVAEMVRVVCPGGTVTTYAWDMLGGGFPLEPIQAEMRAMGLKPVLPPSPDASRMDALRSLWTAAGLEAVETREITVQRTFADFDAFWTTCLLASSIRPMVAAMASGDVERLKTGVHERLPADAARRITYSGRANAIKGRVPA